MISSKIYLIIIASLVTLLLSSLLGNYFLNKKLKSTQKDLVQSEILYKVLVTDLEEVAEQIASREKEFDKWKKQKSEVKYKTIIKWQERVINGTCEEKVKAIGNIDFNNL
jgi:hypothetical protein